jgi:hypothetical protein
MINRLMRYGFGSTPNLKQNSFKIEGSLQLISVASKIEGWSTMFSLRIVAGVFATALALSILAQNTIRSEERAASYQAEHEAAFTQARNSEIESSLVAYNRQRTLAFIQARNAEIDASIATYELRSAERFAEARNAEIETSLVAYNRQRTLAFIQARNAEIEGAIATYENARLPLETASINTSSLTANETMKWVPLVFVATLAMMALVSMPAIGARHQP